MKVYETDINNIHNGGVNLISFSYKLTPIIPPIVPPIIPQKIIINDLRFKEKSFNIMLEIKYIPII